MSKPSLKVVRNEAKKTAEIFLYGIIGDFWNSNLPLTAARFQQQLANLSDVQEIHVHINSPGGDVGEGLAICNAIAASRKNIHTWNDGICASMAAVILCSAKPSNRHAAKGSLTMLHSASSLAWGNALEMRDTADMLDKYDDVLAEIIADAAGQNVDEIKATYMDGKDHWLTAKEAEALGFVTIEDYQAADMPENATTMKMDQVAAFYGKNNTPTPQINNTDMGLLSSKFKTISALAKVAVADRTAEQFKAVNDELEAEGITGATLVADADLQETIDAADKVPGLETKVTDLGTQVSNLTTEKTTLTQKVTDLEAKVAEQAVELGKPAEEVKPPVTNKIDPTGEKPPVVVDYSTSVDAEAKKIWG